MKILTETDHDELANLLVGHKVTKVSNTDLVLDDGTRLSFVGNDGGCSCSAGCYDLTELNGTDNIITNVEFHDSPTDDSGVGEGVYEIFIYADNRRINLARFEGDDGNGYYGTGYTVRVTPVHK